MLVEFLATTTVVAAALLWLQQRQFKAAEAKRNALILDARKLANQDLEACARLRKAVHDSRYWSQSAHLEELQDRAIATVKAVERISATLPLWPDDKAILEGKRLLGVLQDQLVELVGACPIEEAGDSYAPALLAAGIDTIGQLRALNVSLAEDILGVAGAKDCLQRAGAVVGRYL